MARYLACCLAILVVTTLVDAQRSLKTATDEQVNAALNSPRYMRRQMNCLQNLGPCDNIGEEMKSNPNTILHQTFPLTNATIMQDWALPWSVASVRAALPRCTNGPIES